MPFLVSLALMVVSFLITSLTTKQQKQKPAALSEFQFPTAEEGTPMGEAFGDVWVPGWQVVWYGNLRTKKIKSQGKK